jgi:Na+/melibiose symporter-like transporter
MSGGLIFVIGIIVGMVFSLIVGTIADKARVRR